MRQPTKSDRRPFKQVLLYQTRKNYPYPTPKYGLVFIPVNSKIKHRFILLSSTDLLSAMFQLEKYKSRGYFHITNDKVPPRLEINSTLLASYTPV